MTLPVPVARLLDPNRFERNVQEEQPLPFDVLKLLPAVAMLFCTKALDVAAEPLLLSNEARTLTSVLCSKIGL